MSYHCTPVYTGLSNLRIEGIRSFGGALVVCGPLITVFVSRPRTYNVIWIVSCTGTHSTRVKVTFPPLSYRPIPSVVFSTKTLDNPLDISRNPTAFFVLCIVTNFLTIRPLCILSHPLPGDIDTTDTPTMGGNNGVFRYFCGISFCRHQGSLISRGRFV